MKRHTQTHAIVRVKAPALTGLMLICIAFCLTAINCGMQPDTPPAAATDTTPIIAAAPQATVAIEQTAGEAPFILGAEIIADTTAAGRIADRNVEANGVRLSLAKSKSAVKCRIRSTNKANGVAKRTGWFNCADTETVKAQILSEGEYTVVVESLDEEETDETKFTESAPTDVSVTADVAVDGNSKPVIGAIQGAAGSPAVGDTVTLSASHTDADAADLQYCRIDWGDGTVTMSENGCDVGKAHVYAMAGTYNSEMFGSDGKDASAVQSATITVTEPTVPFTLEAPDYTTEITETAAATYEITGTKPAGGAVYSNGIEIIPADGLTTWTHVFSLDSEQNLFVLVAISPDGSKSLPRELSIPRRMPPIDPILCPDTPTLTDQATGTICLYTPFSADLFYSVNGGGKVRIKDAKNVFDKSQMELVSFAPTLAADATSTFTFTAEDPIFALTSANTEWSVRHWTKKVWGTTDYICNEEDYHIQYQSDSAPQYNFTAYSTLEDDMTFSYEYSCAKNCETVTTCFVNLADGTGESSFFLQSCSSGNFIYKFKGLPTGNIRQLSVNMANNHQCHFSIKNFP